MNTIHAAHRSVCRCVIFCRLVDRSRTDNRGGWGEVQGLVIYKLELYFNDPQETKKEKDKNYQPKQYLMHLIPTTNSLFIPQVCKHEHTSHPPLLAEGNWVLPNLDDSKYPDQ